VPSLCIQFHNQCHYSVDKDGGAAAAAATAAAPPQRDGHVFKSLSLFGSEASRMVGSLALIAPSAKFPDA
jgi:hypothetical protein